MNLSEMLEEMKQEQEQLSLAVKEKERVRVLWEGRVAGQRAVQQQLEVDLNRVGKEDMLVEEEIELMNRKKQDLVNMMMKKTEELE